MRNAKLKRLKAAGWKVGTAKDFLGLDEQEATLVDMKLSLIDAVKKSRQKRRLSQTDLAQHRLKPIEDCKNRSRRSFRVAGSHRSRAHRNRRHATGNREGVYFAGGTGCLAWRKIYTVVVPP
jgi:hypothetical protein